MKLDGPKGLKVYGLGKWTVLNPKVDGPKGLNWTVLKHQSEWSLGTKLDGHKR